MSGMRWASSERRSSHSSPTLAMEKLLTRWDMLRTPPDVLVTNYSMLNVVLMRAREDALLDRTRAWLEADRSRAFTLVVDELHTYRGTQGTEVALIIRKLLRRLGLAPDSPQLRCIATSASLDGEDGKTFLQEFFGVDQTTFCVIPGSPRKLPEQASLSRHRLEQLIDSGADPTVVVDGCRTDVALAGACQKVDGTYRATRMSLAEARAFGPREAESDDRLIRWVLDGIARAEGDPDLIAFRAHHFTRLVRGMWACCDPECKVALRPEGGSRIGKLYSTPRARCICGARVLELLYCFECGDVSLGGFSTPLDPADPSEGYYLSSLPVHAGAAEKRVFQRAHGTDYVWYWPGSCPDVNWTHAIPSGGTAKLRFAPATLDPVSGAVELCQPAPDAGTALSIPLPILESEEVRTPAVPEHCPRCESRGRNAELRKFWSGVVRSPIRAHTTGTTRVAQIAVDRIVRGIEADARQGRTIVFTDSRDDAASTAAGMEAQPLPRLAQAAHLGRAGSGCLAGWTSSDERQKARSLTAPLEASRRSSERTQTCGVPTAS